MQKRTKFCPTARSGSRVKLNMNPLGFTHCIQAIFSYLFHSRMLLKFCFSILSTFSLSLLILCDFAKLFLIHQFCKIFTNKVSRKLGQISLQFPLSRNGISTFRGHLTLYMFYYDYHTYNCPLTLHSLTTYVVLAKFNNFYLF